MSITLPLAKFLIQEHSYKALPKKILTLGRQSVLLNRFQAQELFEQFGLRTKESSFELDQETAHAKQNPELCLINDRSFFAPLGVESIDVIDHSGFEGANITLDLCRPIPSIYKNRFDFIFGGGCLDNVWNPSNAMVSATEMLRSGGRILQLETSTSTSYCYMPQTPAYFFDYYIWNRFSDVKLYYGSVSELKQITKDSWPMLFLDVLKTDFPQASLPDSGDRLGFTLCLAEKSGDSTSDQFPAQWCYRSEKDWHEFKLRMRNLQDSQRWVYRGKDSSSKAFRSFDSNWIDVGIW